MVSSGAAAALALLQCLCVLPDSRAIWVTSRRHSCIFALLYPWEDRLNASYDGHPLHPGFCLRWQKQCASLKSEHEIRGFADRFRKTKMFNAMKVLISARYLPLSAIR